MLKTKGKKMEEKKHLNEYWNEQVGLLSRKVLSMPWHNQKFYESYLAETFKYVTHSCKLLQYSADRLPEGELKNCLIQHIEEEKGHEYLALKDLKGFGKKPEDFAELKSTHSIYNDMYEELDEIDPVAPLIGYAMALEGLSAMIAIDVAKIVDENHGEGKASFLKLHGEVDQEHIKESMDILALLEDKQLPIVKDSIRKSCERYSSFMDEIQRVLVNEKAA